MEIAELAAPVRDYFDRFETEFENRFRASIPLADKVVGYLAAKKGKRLRPLMVFLCAALHGRLNSRTMSAAVVIELFHTATLVHDDVVDESDLRRGAPTVNGIWGNKISILIGDLLFSKTLAAIVELQDNEAVDVLAKTAERITEGELLQIAYARRPLLSEQNYLDLIGKKTAALFNASCRLGAMTAGGKDAELTAMADFGENYGLAFQIMDDLLDYSGDPSELGKPTGSDLREGKVTLPLIHALEHADESQRQQILQALNRGVQSDDEAQQIVRFAEDHGGFEYARDKARSYAEKALAVLESYPDSLSRRSLASLVGRSLDRRR